MSADRLNYGVTDAMFLRSQLTDAQRRIYDFCSAVRHGREIDRETLEFFANAFERYATGKTKSVDHALGLKRSRGNPSVRSTNQRAYRVELACAVLVEKEHHPRMTLPVIFDRLVDLYKEKASFIQDCYEEHRKEAVAALAFIRLDIRSMTDPQQILREVQMLLDARNDGTGVYSFNPPRNLPPK